MGAVATCHGTENCAPHELPRGACGRCRYIGDRDTEELDPPVADQESVLDALVPATSSEAQPYSCPYVLPAGGQLTVLLFGMTGAGKSSLGNLIAGSDVFAAADTSRSVTNLDSIGLGDTEINQEKVCASIRAVAASAPRGVDMFCYVMHIGRMTDDSVTRLIYLTQYLWGDESLLNLYIVITWASRYLQDRRAAEEWIQTQVDEDRRFRHVYALVGNNPSRFIFIDNPPVYDGNIWQQVVEDKRRLSRELMLKAFCEHPRDVVPAFVSETVPKVISQRLIQESNALQEKRLEVARIEDALNRESGSPRSSKIAKGSKAGDASSKNSSKINFRQLLRDSQQDESQSQPETPKVVNETSPKRDEEKAKERAGKPTKRKTPSKVKSPHSGKREDTISPRSDGKSSNQSPTSDDAKKENGHDQKQLEVALEKAKEDLEESKKKFTSERDQVQADKDFQANVTAKVDASNKQFQEDFAAVEELAKKEKTSRAKGLWRSMSRTVFGMKKTLTASPEQRFQGLMSRSACRLKPSDSGKACIIFDWDDTLCPTYWLQRVLQPSVGHVPEGSYQQDLSAFVQQLEVVLRTACNIAHVDILTQSNVHWVKQSLEYLRLSGMDIEAVLNDLDIRFHYSDVEQASQTPAKQKGSLDVFTLAKKNSMVKILHAHFGDSPKANWNTLSIGDRYIELDALREVCKERQRRTWRRPICKTVKLPEEPQLEDLLRTLHTLAPQLQPLVAKEKDLDAVFNSVSNTLIGA